MPCVGKCDICERSGFVYPICACKQAHANCFTKGECVLCKEEFYLPTWTDLFFVSINSSNGAGLPNIISMCCTRCFLTVLLSIA